MKALLLLICALALGGCATAPTATTLATTSVTLDNFKLTGELSGDQASFTLTTTAKVEHSKGAKLDVLSGAVALTDMGARKEWHVQAEPNRYTVVFEHGGTFPLQLKFAAAVRQTNEWKAVEFHVAQGVLQRIILQGLPAGTQFEFPGAARPERSGSDFVSYLPSDGAVKLSWKEARPEAEGKLFYSAEMLSQISVSPGLMRQVGLLDFKVMQGELNRVTLLLHGAGEVTRVQGEQVLAWNVEPAPGSADRRLVVQFNQPQKDQFRLLVHAQTPLGAFPQSADALQLRPEGATRFAGYFRIVNDGAVRLEVAQATGLSQVSPEQFPESDTTRVVLRPTGNQRFAYRFSGPDFALRIQADQILPELGVSEVVAYRLGENELAIDAEIELEIREAPLRELLLRVPRGYAIARLNASGLSDYFLLEPEGQPDAELRLVYGQPLSGRQLVQLRLERNKPLGEPTWVLPRLEVAKAKSTRGHIATAADAGFRLTPERTQGLTEIATAFFPRKVPGIQSAFRLSDPSWQATLRVERLPQTVQVDALHIFSIGEGIAYGSSVLNYVISGAPVGTFRVALPDDFVNVEFTGKDVRNWQTNDGAYVVQLHSPVSGPYTLLATYERTFKPHGETLAFTGARPLDAQTEQGHTIIISAYQFQVRPTDVSPSLLPLEPGEVPAEYRLFFDAPILAAYRYNSRPFSLSLALSPLAQGDSLSQVVDRASLTNRISKEGQVLTDARYCLKNRGNTHFGLVLPPGTQLWSASVNGAPVVPVLDKQVNLIPLPQHNDPDAVLTLDLKLAARSKDARYLSIAAPIVNAPVMLEEWRLEPDTGQRLVYRRGSLTPLGGIADISGFAELARAFSGSRADSAITSLVFALLGTALAVLIWRATSRERVYKYSVRHVLGTLVGALALLMGGIALVNFGSLVAEHRGYLPRDVSFLAPVQQAGSALSVQVANIEDKPTVLGFVRHAWPALLGFALWVFGWVSDRPGVKAAGSILGWTLLAWAALRCPNGATAFIVVLAAFILLDVVIPALRRLAQLPRRPAPLSASVAAPGGAAPPVTALLVGGLVGLSLACALSARGAVTRNADFQSAVSQVFNLQAARTQSTPLLLAYAEPQSSSPAPTGRTSRRLQIGDTADSKSALRGQESPIAESVSQEIRIEDKFALATASIRWDAEKGQRLPLLWEPAVLTGIHYPSNSLKLVAALAGSKHTQELLAEKRGVFEVELKYELPVFRQGTQSSLVLPLGYGLVNRLKLTVVNLDVDVFSPQAVSIHREASGSNTVAELVLGPVKDTWVAWQPRSRDVKHEKAVFYAELPQLYVPAAGAIEGVHYVSIRPAQGELSELVFDVPDGAAVTDVSDRMPDASVPAAAATAEGGKPPQGTRLTPGPASAGSIVSLWRFDPDARKLRVTLNPPQSRPFVLFIRSQVATGPLPFEQSVGLVSVVGAANQIGLLGIATGSEVQLDSVTTQSMTPINLEDFPTDVASCLQAQVAGLTLRRAFRYADTNATASLKVSPVEPDVRAEIQETLSLSEDRTVLASEANVSITRAGIFRLSFVMPAGFDIESISGAALSHWTESTTNAGRVITLHLNGKTEGQQKFAISFAGAGVRAARAWQAPQLLLREASKQRGTLLLVPEQGMRLQAVTREGLTPLDPQKSGIRQKGVLAFNILQAPWSLALDIEQVDPWVEVTSLQHATVTEAQVKIAVNLQYQIENAGLKAFRVLVPTNAEGLHFQGEQVADFLPVAGTVTNGMQEWEIKLHRKVIGPYLLQASYQTLVPNQATETVLRGLQAVGVNLQRGFVTVQSASRLQVRPEPMPLALQPAEWQSIPRALQQGIRPSAANFTYRLVENAFDLPLKLERHEPAKLLPARVNSVTFKSVISDAGVMLTHVALEMIPGDKRLLNLTLPKDARFWFAFVNQNGVWPWREQDRILIPLEQQARGNKPIQVEIFYACDAGVAGTRALDLELLAPKLDLPLENITWRVSLSDKWRLKEWSGSSLQLQQDEVTPRADIDLDGYLAQEALRQHERTREAETCLAAGNAALEQGDPTQARSSFEAAYGLSTHDAAFNEDARVQLHNIKLQQALVGLNVRQAAAAGDPAALGARFRDLRSRKEINYTQQDAKDIIDRNTADDNAAYMRLAERIIQQQDAAVSSPAAIRASIPEQGRILTFKRAVLVDALIGTSEDLKLDLKLVAVKAASSSVRVLILVATLLFLAGFAVAARSFRRSKAAR